MLAERSVVVLAECLAAKTVGGLEDSKELQVVGKLEIYWVEM